MNEESQSDRKTRLTLAEVARGVGTSPQNFNKTYVKKGKITVKRDDLDKPYIELVEVLRVFGSRFRVPAENAPVDMVDGRSVDKPVNSVAPGSSTGLSELINQNTELSAKLAAAERQLSESLERERIAQEREAWLRGQVDKLTDVVKLLEGPKVAQEAPKSADTDEKKPGWLSRLFGGK